MRGLLTYMSGYVVGEAAEARVVVDVGEGSESGKRKDDRRKRSPI